MKARNRIDAQNAAHVALAEARAVVRHGDFRKGVVFGLLFVAALGAYYGFGGLGAPGGRRIAVFAAIGVCAVFGLLAVRSVANEVAHVVRPRGGAAPANVLRWIITLTGYLVVVTEVLSLLDVPVDRLLVSGAITGVIVGIAAQQSLGNAFAGLVLLFSRPFVVGQRITLRSGALGGDYDGEVTAITLMYTRLATDDGPITLPNSGVLASATGPRPAIKVTPEPEPAPPPPARGPRRRPRPGLRAAPVPARRSVRRAR